MIIRLTYKEISSNTKAFLSWQNGTPNQIRRYDSRISREKCKLVMWRSGIETQTWKVSTNRKADPWRRRKITSRVQQVNIVFGFFSMFECGTTDSISRRNNRDGCNMWNWLLPSEMASGLSEQKGFRSCLRIGGYATVHFEFILHRYFEYNWEEFQYVE